MSKIVTIAITLARTALARLDKEDADAILDAVEVRILDRLESATGPRRVRLKAAYAAIQTFRLWAGIEDDDADQRNPV